MSVLIRGMEMPESCDDCFMAGCSVYDHLDSHDHMVARPHDCPLVELPPHGDLIDRDELKMAWDGVEENMHTPVAVIRALIDDAPTIIDAEGSE